MMQHVLLVFLLLDVLIRVMLFLAVRLLSVICAYATAIDVRKLLSRVKSDTISDTKHRNISFHRNLISILSFVPLQLKQ